MKNIYLGVDIGSVSTNVVAIDAHGDVLFDRYIRTNGQPIDSVKKGMAQLKDAVEGQGFEVGAVGVTEMCIRDRVIAVAASQVLVPPAPQRSKVIHRLCERRQRGKYAEQHGYAYQCGQ